MQESNDIFVCWLQTVTTTTPILKKQSYHSNIVGMKKTKLSLVSD